MGSSFKAGYGQAKADTLMAITEAIKLLHREMHSSEPGFKPTSEQKKELRRKIDVMRWVRSIVKAQRSPR